MDYQEVNSVGSYPQQPYQTSKPKTHKFLWFSIFGILLITIIIILFSFFNSENISDKKLIEGTTISAKENNSIKFKFGEDNHNIKINFIGLDSVDLTISSDPIEIKGLKINEIREIDLNGDEIADLRIKLVSIENGKAIISVKKIEKEFCEENWSCDDWNSCVLGVQGRDCVDLNGCGTTENRPNLERTCESETEGNENETLDLNNESDLNNINNSTNSSLNDSIENNVNNSNDSLNVCAENWTCSGWTECLNGIQTRSCNDLNNCETTENKPSVSKNCAESTLCNNDGECNNEENVLYCVDCLGELGFFSNKSCESFIDCDNDEIYSICSLGFCAKPIQELKIFIEDNFNIPPNCQDISCENCEKGYLTATYFSSDDLELGYCVECTPNGFASCNSGYKCYFGKCIPEN